MNPLKIIKEEISLLEVSDKLYDLLKREYSESRLIMTKDNQINFISKKDQQKPAAKPNGLWYGIGTEWIDWTRMEMSEWEHDNVFEVLVHENKILLIKNYDELDDFTEKFKSKESGIGYFDDLVYHINWTDVANYYSGIEISPYIWPARNDYGWYYGWDVASGCIWDSSAIKSINKITV